MSRGRTCLGLVACLLGCGGAPPEATRTAEPPVPRVTDTQILQSLDVELGTTGSLARQSDTRLEDRVRRYRGFVRDRLDQDAFYRAVLPRLFPHVFDQGNSVVPLTLQTGQVNGAPFYYLDEPCPPSELVAVRPWWDPAHDVAICKDSYRPELTEDTRTGSSVHVFCEYNWLLSVESRARICRCGAKLLSCARDEAQDAALTDAMADEPLLTMAHVIRTHQPFSTVLTTQATVRAGLADFIYSRNEFYRSGQFELAPSAPVALRPRPAAYGGGILSTPDILFLHDSQRVIAAWLWQDFLCTPLRSTDVHASQMFAMKSSSLRHAGHMDLAEMDGCKTCHARLENALQVFAPVTPVKHGIRVDLDAAPLHAKFFLADDTDLRGEGPATFAWLGDMISRQPEFRACVVDKVEALIYAGLPVPPEVDAAMKARFAQGQDLARLFEDTVVARYLGAPALAVDP